MPKGIKTVCNWCGKTFDKKNNYKYCSEECGRQYRLSEYRDVFGEDNGHLIQTLRNEPVYLDRYDPTASVPSHILEEAIEYDERYKLSGEYKDQYALFKTINEELVALNKKGDKDV